MKPSNSFRALGRSYPLQVASLFLAMACNDPTVAHCETTNSTARKPNVLLVMTDDQGWGDIHSHANADIDTPHLDALAASGARFDRFYVAPVCAPTRASLLTGRWHPRTGVSGVTRTAETMRSDERTMAEIFRDAGYRTAAFGKWHNGAHWPHDPNGQGFDQFLGFSAGHWDLYFDSPLTHNQTPVQGEGFIIDYLTSKAIDFIQAENDQPWFCYVPYNTPHTPWQVPNQYWEKYSSRNLPETTACAYAMVENIDDNLGRLLAAIDSSGAADNTVVLFLTDNGANTDRWDGNMRGQKGSLHEGGSRVPLFMRFPGRIPQGIVVNTLAAHIDLLPTLMDLAGIAETKGKPLDGKSLVTALMHGNDPALEDRTLFNHWADRTAVRTKRWRLVKDRAKQANWQLFDMLADPSETTDVASIHPAVAKDLQEQYESWWADVSIAGFDPIPTEVGHEEAPIVTLLGHEALLSGEGISYNGKNGWANDWIDHWTSPSSKARWPLRVIREGTYRVQMQVACPPESKGTKIVLRVASTTLPYSFDVVHIPVKIPTGDKVGRKETTPQTWLLATLDDVELPAGEYDLTLQRIEPGTAVQVKSVILNYVDPNQ